MATSAKGSLFLVPFAPEKGSFKEHRARGMGTAAALSKLLARCGHPVSVADFSVAVDDPVEALQSDDAKDWSWTAVGGYYDINGLSPLRLKVIDLDRQLLAGERTFEIPPTEIMDSARDIAEWLRGFGESSDGEAGTEPLPETLDQLIVEARATGLEWLIEKVETVVDLEFLTTLQESMDFFQNRVGEKFRDRRLRVLILTIVPTMRAKSQPTGTDPVVVEMLGQLSERLDPAGMEFIWPALATGISRGIEPVAFQACRGYTLMALGRPQAALSDFESVRVSFPRAGWFALGRAYEDLEQWDAAIDAFNNGSSLTKFGEVFVDIVRGLDAEPLPNAPTWLGVLLANRGRVEFRAGQFLNAESTLRQALEAGAEPISVLEMLAHLYRRWAIELMGSNPREARERLLQHMEVLDRLFEIDPRMAEVEAALSTADYLDDMELRNRWLERLRRLEHAKL